MDVLCKGNLCVIIMRGLLHTNQRWQLDTDRSDAYRPEAETRFGIKRRSALWHHVFYVEGPDACRVDAVKIPSEGRHTTRCSTFQNPKWTEGGHATRRCWTAAERRDSNRRWRRHKIPCFAWKNPGLKFDATLSVVRIMVIKSFLTLT